MKNNTALPRLSQGGHSRKGKSTSRPTHKAKSTTSHRVRHPFSLAPNTSKRSPARPKASPPRARVSNPFPRPSARSPAQQHRLRTSLPVKIGKNARGTKGKSVFEGLGKRGRAVASSSESGSSDSESDSGSESGSKGDQEGSGVETDETQTMDSGAEEHADTTEIGERKLRELKKGPLMTMHLEDAQQYAANYESCIAGSKELFIDFLGNDIAGGLLEKVKAIQTRMESSSKLYKREKEKLVSNGAKINQKAEAAISRLVNLATQLVSYRKTTAADLQASRETMDQELDVLATKFEKSCAAIQKQAKETSTKKGARR